ncbi:CBF-domain-containing protein [Patellaria atrata CBS 101060]|uniref:CBF-domain-containing protein n=1 Tax=Patellaria atrata CBS 101060 TaxID=1346257 RepID=A0A9P4S5I9_9PEZI|nr:CBF-domain-containing protein [Patellaria atrata CBS 101060]
MSFAGGSSYKTGVEMAWRWLTRNDIRGIFLDVQRYIQTEQIMPYINVTQMAVQKRKRYEEQEIQSVPRKKSNTRRGEASTKDKARAKKSRESSIDINDTEEEILNLESQITASRKYLNNITALLSFTQNEETEDETRMLAAIALCRVFSRLFTDGSLNQGKHNSKEERTVVQWLCVKYHSYVQTLLGLLVQDDPARQTSTFVLIMQLLKGEVIQMKAQDDFSWNSGIFRSLLSALLSAEKPGVILRELVDKYVNVYGDIRFYLFQIIERLLMDAENDGDRKEKFRANALEILSAIKPIKESDQSLERSYGEAPQAQNKRVQSLVSQKKQAQIAWLRLLSTGLGKDQRKRVLTIMSSNIVPWFIKVELLMDFLTDSYDTGGATSLLALSGLFDLIQEKNLDYPSFYPKLYSLLNEDLIYSKHRSRFFRLLDTFMASTHLPAALVASFIKRLSRLALHGPPAAIVVIVPWIYNMLKTHPACTFMIHRETPDELSRRDLEENGMDDPFDMSLGDPMETGALESSLWEIETLQSHYHPNVATLAKIISEQFTKKSYNLEDFLDHSYTGLIESELQKEMKKMPVIEFDIPKRIFMETDTELNRLGSLVNMAMKQSCSV